MHRSCWRKIRDMRYMKMQSFQIKANRKNLQNINKVHVNVYRNNKDGVPTKLKLKIKINSSNIAG